MRFKLYVCQGILIKRLRRIDTVKIAFEKAKNLVTPVCLLSGVLLLLGARVEGRASSIALTDFDRKEGNCVGSALSARYERSAIEEMLSHLRAKPETGVGTIIAGYNHAWGENIGWVDFSPEEDSIEIGENILSGWIRIENLGWVHLGGGNPRNGCRYSNLDAGDYGVNNDGKGSLSGWAWGETFGWICFDGVSIDEDGEFSGYAFSRNVGYILLNSSGRVGFMVRTDPYPWARIGGRAEIKLADKSSSSPAYRGLLMSSGGILTSITQVQLFPAYFSAPGRYLEEGSSIGRVTQKQFLYTLSAVESNSERGPPRTINTRRLISSPDNAFVARLFCAAGIFSCRGLP